MEMASYHAPRYGRTCSFLTNSISKEGPRNFLRSVLFYVTVLEDCGIREGGGGSKFLERYVLKNSS